jgi:hypothetical protein
VPDDAIFVGNDTRVELAGLLDASTGNLISSADVSMTLVDENDEPVDGQSWPATLAPLGNGRYASVISQAVELLPGRNYRLYVDVSAGATLAASFVRVLRAKERN